MLRFRKPAVAHIVSKLRTSLADHRTDIGVAFDEARQMFTAQAEYIFGDQHLPVAGR